MHVQSLGSVTLKSADPNDPPIIDLNVLDHPYDRRVLIEALRESYRFLQSGIFPVDKILDGPKSDSDEDLLVWYWNYINFALLIFYCRSISSVPLLRRGMRWGQ
jgi:hypothetical protein